MFPRHVLEYIVKDGSLHAAGEEAASPPCPGSLAGSHDNITIMFMDIVGFTTMSKEVEPVEVGNETMRGMTINTFLQGGHFIFNPKPSFMYYCCT